MTNTGDIGAKQGLITYLLTGIAKICGSAEVWYRRVKGKIPFDIQVVAQIVTETSSTVCAVCRSSSYP